MRSLSFCGIERYVFVPCVVSAVEFVGESKCIACFNLLRVNLEIKDYKNLIWHKLSIPKVVVLTQMKLIPIGGCVISVSVAGDQNIVLVAVVDQFKYV